ncbi:hypothetical protein EDB85DRAFT_2155730 [Lactarius pseudohatsudake]|nr:hypothetical protein EDB85DRAFT_2155730 [Lactarius pseudohatsudake]
MRASGSKGGSGGMSRKMGIGVDAVWGFELNLNSPFSDPAAARDDAASMPGQAHPLPQVNVELKKHPGVPQLPDLKFCREEKRLRHSIRAETFRPVPTTGKYDDGTEPTLSSLTCLVAIHSVSPAVSETPSIRSGKTKVQEGKAKGKRFYSFSTRSRHNLNASLPLSGVAPVRKRLLRYAPVHLRLLQLSGLDIGVGLVELLDVGKAVSSTRSSSTEEAPF